MAFSMNSAEATSGSALKPEGDYECIITACEERTTKNGKTGLNLTLVIRNDVEGQKYGNACLFYTTWKAVNPSDKDKAVNGYIYGQIMALGKAAQLPEGKEYADLNAYLADLCGKCVIAHVVHEEYNGETRERVKWLNPTKHPDCKHVFKSKVTSDTVARPQNVQFANANVKVDADTGEVTNEDDDYPF